MLEITFVDTGFVLFAILAVAGEMEHFLLLILGKILSPEISRVCSFPGQLLKPQCLTLKQVQSWEKKKSYGKQKVTIGLLTDGIWNKKLLTSFPYSFPLQIFTCDSDTFVNFYLIITIINSCALFMCMYVFAHLVMLWGSVYVDREAYICTL